MTSSFWEWFSSISGLLGSNLDNPEILKVLDDWISSFGEISWEVGPGVLEPNALAISPSGQKDRLVITTEIVAAAPECPGWEFHPAKPPKNWDLKFFVEGYTGRPAIVTRLPGNMCWSYEMDADLVVHIAAFLVDERKYPLVAVVALVNRPFSGGGVDLMW